MHPTASWSSRLVLALLALQLASACDPNPPPPPTPDTTPPSTRATPNGGTFNAPVSVTLLCEDGTGSGCDATYYTTDGSTPSASSTRYTAPVVLSQNTPLKFFSVDKSGNTESVQSQSFVVDTVAPTTTATPAGSIFNTAQSVVLACDDGTGSGCAATHYTTDGSEPTTSSPRYTTALALSTDTTLKFFSVDAAGNEEPVRTETYVIDTVKPTAAAAPAGGFYRTARDVTLTCTDNTGGSGCASIHYTTDGSLPDTGSTAYTAPLSISADTPLKFVAVDKADNVSTVQTEVYTFDTEAPTTTVSPTGGTYRTRQSITLTCADSGPSGCEGTYYTLDGSTPTTASTLYTGPFTLSANTTLTFFSVDKAGNEETARTETYVIDLDETAPTTTVSHAGGMYFSELSVSLYCEDGTSGIGCEGTYYTLDGSTPTTASTLYTGPITITATTTLKFFSVDKANNAESTRTEQYTIPTPANTSAQIASVRAMPDGTVDELIDYALVTYAKPATGSSDPAGIFIQAEKNGPALFVPIDPSGLDIQAGHHVNVHVTEKRTVNGVVMVTRFSRLTLYRTADSVEPFVNDVSSIDLVDNLNNYESELISITGSVASTFAGAGAGHVAANLVTLGNSFNPNLKLRLTTAVQDVYDVTPDCVVTTQAPLWRFTAQAQPSAWADRDLTVRWCPGPKVMSATATSETGVTVNFDRKLDPASVLADGSQFIINDGLSVTAATVTVSGRQVQLTTSPQEPGAPHWVAVSSSVKDTRGSGVEPTRDTTTFTGFIEPAVLKLSEVAPSITGGKDLVELLVVKGGSVDKFTLVQGASLLLATFPNVLVTSGDIIVVHLRPTLAPADAPSSETTSKSEFGSGAYSANYDSAWDFLGTSSEIGYSQRVLRVRDGAGVTQDGVSFYRTPGAGGVTSDFYAQLQLLQDEGQWLPLNCEGVPCSDTSTPKAWEVSADWNGLPFTKGTTVRRISATDTNTKDDWAIGPSSFGEPNP